MEYDSPLIEALLVKRYKRFLADCRLPSGEVVTAHCANPGSMKTCLQEEGRVWLSESSNPKRKLKYSWEIAEVSGSLININTSRTNAVVKEGLLSGIVKEFDFAYELKSEVKIGDSRLDFMLASKDQNFYVEVKNVTMAGTGDGELLFPDSVTKRGTKHLNELIKIVEGGGKAAMLYCCSRSGTHSMRPATDIDPLYSQTLTQAKESGVLVLAYGCIITPQELKLDKPVDVIL